MQIFLEDGGTSADLNVVLFKGCPEEFSGGSAGCAMEKDVVDHMYSLLRVGMEKAKSEETSGGIPKEEGKYACCT